MPSGAPNTTLRQRCRVQEILATPNGEAVTGVRYENADGASEIIAADLVVDASGRGASTLGLLKSTGRPLPEETTIGIDLGYATCVFAVPDYSPTDWKGARYPKGVIFRLVQNQNTRITIAQDGD